MSNEDRGSIVREIDVEKADCDMPDDKVMILGKIPDTSGAHEVPCYSRGGHCGVNIEVEGVKVPMIVDSGASKSYMSSLKFRGQTQFRGFLPVATVRSTSLTRVEVCQIKSLLIGGAPLTGEAGRSTFERTGSRPTAEIVGLHSGYAGDGLKTIVPATANVKVTFRLVPDQEPDEIAAAFLAWLRDRIPADVECHVEEEGRVRPALTPVDHPSVQAAANAIERVWGRSPYFVREGGSGPEEPLGRVLDAPVVFLGVGLPDDNIHAPNERIVLDQFWKGLLAVGELWFELAATPGVVKGVR
jgi:acetylornithine deacetylase/succinyl-diaminopimelate desuccinylase-like protein